MEHTQRERKERRRCPEVRELIDLGEQLRLATNSDTRKQLLGRMNDLREKIAMSAANERKEDRRYQEIAAFVPHRSTGKSARRNER